LSITSTLLRISAVSDAQLQSGRSFTAWLLGNKRRTRDWHHGTDHTPSAGLLTTKREGDLNHSFAIIINLPESLGSKEAKKLMRELKLQIKGEPPLVMMDLSRLTRMDCAGLDGLLLCMREIAKHDGAIQVRGISPEAATFLELFRMDRLLQTFATLPTQALDFTLAAVATAEGRPSAAVQSQLVAA
jgi:anti-anti-sigma regulatory factor